MEMPGSPAARVTHRHAYPPEAVDLLLEHLKVVHKPHARIVEVAAGTGTFTEILAARSEGFEVAAVESQPAMRTRLKEKELDGTRVYEGSSTNVPLDDEWGDACIVAGAFHWFANPDTLKELRRVLKTNGVLGMIWNVESYNKPKSWEAKTGWEQRLNEWICSLPSDGHPRFRDEKWQDVFQQQLTANVFQILKDSLNDGLPKFSLPLGDDWVRWTIWLSEDALWARINTLTQVAALTGERREDAVRTFQGVLRAGDVERNEEGEIAIHGVTYFAWTSKI